MKEFIIKNNESNQRFDKYLLKLLPNATKGFLYKMLRKKNITYNGKKATGNEMLKTGDVIKVFFSDDTFNKFSRDIEEVKKDYEYLKKLEAKNIKVVFEDDNILIVNKPFNMLSQKANSTDISANEYLLGYLIRENKLSFDDFITFKPSVCNRLDRNTTGLLLMGKTLKGSQELSKMLKDRSLGKFYHAIVSGELTKGQHLKGFLTKNNSDNTVVISEKKISEDSDIIETSYKPMKAGDGWTLLEVHLITGKTHQIRAHLASIGHPIIGDMKYGDIRINREYKDNYKIKSQLLHAYRLEFPNGKIYIAEEPENFKKFK